jgi:hypothetical protein
LLFQLQIMAPLAAVVVAAVVADTQSEKKSFKLSMVAAAVVVAALMPAAALAELQPMVEVLAPLALSPPTELVGLAILAVELQAALAGRAEIMQRQEALVLLAIASTVLPSVLAAQAALPALQ